MAASGSGAGSHERRNWLVHILYVRREHDACLAVIEEALEEARGLAEYPLYVKALILRQRGAVAESLTLFQAAACLNPQNVCNLKQVGRSLYLLGRHRAALEVYDELLRLSERDWEVWHNRGLCRVYLKQYDEAIEDMMRAKSLERHDATFLQLGAIHALRDNFRAAAETYLEALEHSPGSAELLTAAGLAYLRLGENGKALELLDASLARDPTDPRTVLAAGSLIQDKPDPDGALLSYRVAAAPNSAPLWSNIGMCFYRKERYMHLGVALSRLDDLDNACAAYDKALDSSSRGWAQAFGPATVSWPGWFTSHDPGPFEALEVGGDHLCELNYAITLALHGELEQALSHFQASERLLTGLLETDKCVEPGMLEQRQLLAETLGVPLAEPPGA